MSLTIITQPSGGVAYADDANTVYLERREPHRGDNDRSTTDTWGGATSAIKELYSQLAANPMIGDVKVNQQGASSTLTAVWKVDFLGNTTTPQEQGVPESEAEEWNVAPIEIPTALAAHPYFQVAYTGGSGELIEDELAAADLAISNGEPYTAGGAYKEQVSRYYALRMAGVEEYPQWGIEITHTYSTDDQILLAAVCSGVGLVIQPAALLLPQGLQNAIAAIPRIDSYTSAAPSSYVLEVNSLEYLQRPPQIRLNRIAGEVDRFQVVETYWGIWKWSAVLYPGGTWDPQGETT